MATDVNISGEQRIGNYKIIRQLLPGQNSTILEVAQEGTGKRFALKELLPSKATDSAERKSFFFEAKLGQDLRHPNLIRVQEFVRDKNAPYFVMDLFPSDHLRLILVKRRDWLRSRLHKIIEQSVAALAYMHDQGWVHRDIKPENILVNKTSEVRVIDYALAKKVPTGLSKLFAGKPPCEGTYSYMSPEQIRRETPAIAADIYSLGITCYELACGRPPFRANSPGELLNKHVYEPPAPITFRDKEITSEFAELVMQMIRKKPAERPKDLHEMLSRFNRMRVYQGDADLQPNL